jgi:hypothetical protein
MTAVEWNERFPVGTPVKAYPRTRQDEPLMTRTRSEAWELGHGEAVVSVEGYRGGIILAHVKPLPRRYREREGSTWTEVSPVGADPVSLSGPGPCRGMREVPREVLERDFEEVTLNV